MPASFLSRHRTICEVLEEIRSISISAQGDEYPTDRLEQIITLVDEAKTYAEAMSAKLSQYKREKEEGR